MLVRGELLLMDKKKLIRIITPILIGLVVAGIWFAKNIGTVENNPSAPQNESSDDTPVADDPNFELEAEAIDLDVLKAYGLPIIIDFGSDSCIPCQQMAPVLKTMKTVMH